MINIVYYIDKYFYLAYNIRYITRKTFLDKHFYLFLRIIF